MSGYHSHGNHYRDSGQHHSGGHEPNSLYQQSYYHYNTGHNRGHWSYILWTSCRGNWILDSKYSNDQRNPNGCGSFQLYGNHHGRMSGYHSHGNHYRDSGQHHSGGHEPNSLYQQSYYHYNTGHNRGHWSYILWTSCRGNWILDSKYSNDQRNPNGCGSFQLYGNHHGRMSGYHSHGNHYRDSGQHHSGGHEPNSLYQQSYYHYNTGHNRGHWSYILWTSCRGNWILDSKYSNDQRNPNGCGSFQLYGNHHGRMSGYHSHGNHYRDSGQHHSGGHQPNSLYQQSYYHYNTGHNRGHWSYILWTSCRGNWILDREYSNDQRKPNGCGSF